MESLVYVSRNVACILFSLPMGEECAAPFLERLRRVCHQLHAGPVTRVPAPQHPLCSQGSHNAGMFCRKTAAILPAAAAGAPRCPFVLRPAPPCTAGQFPKQGDSLFQGWFVGFVTDPVTHLCLCKGQHRQNSVLVGVLLPPAQGSAWRCQEPSAPRKIKSRHQAGKDPPAPLLLYL